MDEELNSDCNESWFEPLDATSESAQQNPNDPPSLHDILRYLALSIGREIDSVEAELGNLGDDIDARLCHRFAHDWELYEENGHYPDWLRWIVEGVLKKRGITEL